MIINKLKVNAIFKEMRWSIWNLVMITFKQLKMNQNLALNNP